MNESSSVNFSGMPEQAMGVITAPRQFFGAMPRSGGYLDPIVFLVTMGLVAALVQIVLGFLGLGMAGTPMMAAAGFLVLIMVPLFLIVGGFIAAAVLFVIWRFLGSTRGFECAFRCVAYMSAILPITTLLSAVPYLGTVAQVAWGTWLAVVSSGEVHEIREQTARLVFGIIGAIGLIIGLSNEYAGRHFHEQVEEMSRQFGEDMQNKSPEEVGEAVGEFLKGLEKATRQDGQQGTGAN